MLLETAPVNVADRGVAAHSRRVSERAAALGASLGLDSARRSRLELAGMLHDIGKVDVPTRVLEKAGPLTVWEWELIAEHPLVGARMLHAPGLEDVAHWTLTHHERPDGQGYPLGLSGEQIPLEARILAVADAYDAMTDERPYRPAMTHCEAVCELRDGAGTQFDGKVVAAFARLWPCPALGDNPAQPALRLVSA